MIRILPARCLSLCPLFLCALCVNGLTFPVFSSFAHAQAPAKKQNVTRTRHPNPLQQLLDRAEKAIAEEKYADAVPLLEEFLKAEPKDAYAHFQLAYTHSGLNDWQKAIASYRRAAELKPDMAAAHLNLGLLLYEHESPQASIEPLRRAAELLANEARPHFLLATALERSGKPVEAIAEYRAAATLDPKDADTQLALGRALLNSGRYAEAEISFRQVLATDQDFPHARIGLAQALLAQKKLPAAAAELETYLAANSNDPQAWQQLATLRFETESYDAALQALDRADAAARATPESLRLRADVYLAQKKLDEAVAVIRTLVEQQPNDALSRARLGRLYLEKRDFPAAERELLHSLQLDSTQLDPLRDLVSVYYLGEKYDATLRMMDRLAQREPPSAFFWFIRATCYDKLLLKAEAVAADEKFRALEEGRSQNHVIEARARIRTLKRELQNKR